ncbi:bifunctional diaminohydroxyphosphoribosylaminopyrimidine deaminase/5-amino-6-(5-phosphoribosylamino)uracil reductase RibD [Rhizorhabdus sp.]|uniref:bifunctional diaminohydroxyphosphoribosylaminopyrimidine deaminase/5-amino-6-(5-phosphoribosylamino)uracil reductase RibD n=1 Tax=Rhizorhabdus sp. TaxID=1968843 RepID=UPI0025D373C2|nr:bifunctional diaminohydroxyphosphoribosylaminopyrimidine deaminase/5-amino-6-(5-phosphoribosylamino)uracil reductase RibD [Rhizorhabdus sp.]
MASNSAEDRRWMAAAVALAGRGRGRTTPNPNVGCVIVRDQRVIGRGWTQPGGRPHAEAYAIAAAGDIMGATLYATLEPCAHVSPRGPACADLIAAARPDRVVIAVRDPDPRTDGQGIERLRAAGIAVTTGIEEQAARGAMAGFLTRRTKGRPHVTLKLAVSLDGRIALPDGSSRWITGPAARAHAHLERARHEMILVGRGTLEADQPRLDVRLPGLEERSPRRAVFGHGAAPDGWAALRDPGAIGALEGVDHLFVEGGAGTAAAFLQADLVDRLLLYTAPIVVGAGQGAIGDIGLADLAHAHDRWRLADTRMLGSDRLSIYERI